MVTEGHQVRVVCLKSDRTVEQEIIDGIEVIRISLKAASWPRFLNPLKFVEFIFQTQKYLKDADLVHVNDFEPLPVAWWGKVTGKKFKTLYDAHEFASEKNGLQNLSRNFIRTTERFFGKRVDEIITVSEGIAREYEKRHKREKVEVILNVPMASGSGQPSNKLREALNIAPDKMIFLYQGKFLIDRGIPFLIEAFEDIDERAALVFMGNGTLQTQVENAARDMDNVFFQPAVPYVELLSFTSSADFGLLTTENVCLNHWYCMPNKLFEYIQSGIPIISTNLHDCKEVIERNHVGLVLESDDAIGVRKTIKKAVATNPEEFKTGLTEAAAKYNWQVEQARLLRIYKRILADG